MVVLVAWPWQVMLCAVEALTDPLSTVAHPRLDEPARNLQTEKASSKWCQGDGPALALVANVAAEEDDSVPHALFLALAPERSTPGRTRVVDRPAPAFSPRPDRCGELHLRLRC